MHEHQSIPMIKLDDEKIRWIVKSKDDKIKNSDIANVLKGSVNLADLGS